ncbi:hypothetical protein HNE05_08560 [Aquipseudomonas campi]|uniref:Secreted protein n=1 Tax=Aquipseudomonas campi TaxID=2731681 RepID=A0A6M8FGG2_9GAMM|nr:hypothetical protein [Pseudomonas campi]QKE63412.1 hypothetical protein HNE05_08560 [Pseudomonas campi]
MHTITSSRRLLLALALLGTLATHQGQVALSPALAEDGSEHRLLRPHVKAADTVAENGSERTHSPRAPRQQAGRVNQTA